MPQPMLAIIEKQEKKGYLYHCQMRGCVLMSAYHAIETFKLEESYS